MTWGGSAIFGLLVLRTLYSYRMSPQEPVDAWAAGLEIFLLASLPLVCYLLSPLGYSVRDGVLVIHRPLFPVEIPLTDIDHIEMLSPDDISGSYRLFGVGGLFGYFGVFFQNDLGIARFYLRNSENPILIDSKTRGRLLLSPDSPGLIQALTLFQAG